MDSSDLYFSNSGPVHAIKLGMLGQELAAPRKGSLLLVRRPHGVGAFFDIGIVVLMVVIALCAQVLIKRAAGSYDFSAHNAVAGNMLAISGIVYAVVLGFVVVVAWEAFQRADTTAFAEVNAAGDMYRYAPALGEPLARTVRADIRRYIQLEIDEDWPAMERGAVSKAARDQANRLVADFVHAPPDANSFA